MDLPSYEPTDDTPRFRDPLTGIKVCFPGRGLQTVFDAGHALPLLGVYRAGHDTLELLGQGLEAHLRVVVTHRESRATWVGGILPHDAPERPASSTPPAGRGGRIVLVEGYFNIDLRTQCNFVPSEGTYWVVALLGRMASPVLEFEVRAAREEPTDFPTMLSLPRVR